MNSLRCSNCSFLNFATASACKRCGFQFESDAATEWNSPPDTSSEPYAAQAAEGNSYFWDQPAYTPSYIPPRPVQSNSGRGKIVAGVVFLAVAALVSFVAVPKLLKKTKSPEFANVSWSEYRAPDNKFSVTLPGTPKQSVVYQQTPMGRTPVTVLEAQVSKEGGCILMHADYPVGDKQITEDTLYEYMLSKSGGVTKGFTMGARRFVNHGGYKGLEIALESTPESKMEAIGMMRLFWVSPRLYVVLSIGPDTEDFRAFQPKCYESFKIHSAR